ncbi:hypothetical protein [Sinomonas sp. G460-2]|uniref:hypothetical protein n=1 Tax=Sinomonas sp. G460-2 TaxID=3393464 RepID=UPI0039EE85F5
MLTALTSELVIRSAAPFVENPLDWTKPDFNVFGIKFKNASALVLGGIWGLVLIVIAGAFLLALGRWGLARNRGHVDDIAEGAQGVKKTALVFGCSAAAGVILGFILALTGAIGA